MVASPDKNPKETPPKNFRHLVIVGGGAAGCFAAVNVAEKNPDIQITLLEAGSRPLQKVAISGGGRCNVTHHCFEIPRLVNHYPRGQKALHSVFHRFQPEDTVRWFAQKGLKLKTESDGRMFPISDDSADVIQTLLTAMRKHHIQLETNARVTAIRRDGQGFHIDTSRNLNLWPQPDAVLIATGYSPVGWQLAKSLGHSVIEPVPSLFPFKIQSPVIAGLQGISVLHTHGQLKVGKQKFEAEGPVLITHQGLSGPVIYRLSAYGARALAESQYQGTLVLDLLPELSEDVLRSNLESYLRGECLQKKLSNTKWEPLSQRLWLSLLVASGMDDLEARGESISKKHLNRLLENLKRLTLPVSGKSPSKEEFVSCGGVPLSEVDMTTMASKRCPGLYLAGEIMDIDGLTGGFNFQACWSAGWILSEALRRD